MAMCCRTNGCSRWSAAYSALQEQAFPLSGRIPRMVSWRSRWCGEENRSASGTCRAASGSPHPAMALQHWQLDGVQKSRLVRPGDRGRGGSRSGLLGLQPLRRSGLYAGAAVEAVREIAAPGAGTRKLLGRDRPVAARCCAISRARGCGSCRGEAVPAQPAPGHPGRVCQEKQQPHGRGWVERNRTAHRRQSPQRRRTRGRHRPGQRVRLRLPRARMPACRY